MLSTFQYTENQLDNPEVFYGVYTLCYIQTSLKHADLIG